MKFSNEVEQLKKKIENEDGFRWDRLICGIGTGGIMRI